MAKRETPFEHIRNFALGYPESHEDHPWGETVIKVRRKGFVFMRSDARGLVLSVKLPRSRDFALDYGFTAPTGYGLGKSGWITARFETQDTPPIDVLEAWIDESYRAVA